MAQKKIIELEVITKGQKNVDDLNDTLEEQRLILIELERELIKVEELQKKTSKTNLAAQKNLTDQANHLKDAIKDQRLSLKELNAEKRNAAKLEKDLTGEKVKAYQITQLLDDFTGGYATKVRDAYEGIKEMGVAIKNTTLAQLRMNLAFLANPIVIFSTAIVGLTAAFAKYASVMTDGLVSTTESFINMIKSLGNPFKFASLQAETYAKNLKKIKDAQDDLQLDRAIQVLRAYGQDTIDLELQRAENKIATLKEGEEGYDKALTDILVLRARKDKEQGEKSAKDFQDAKIKELERLQLKWQLEQEAKQFNKEYYELFGKESAMSFQEAFNQVIEEAFDPNMVPVMEEYDPDTDPELQASLDRNNRLVKSYKERDKMITESNKKRLNDLILVTGTENKIGKALLVARGIMMAKELAMEASKTIAFSKQALARSTMAVAEGTAQTAKIGFPQNIPMLLGYATQAVGIVSAIRSAVKGSNIPLDITPNIVNQAISTPLAERQAPAFNVVGVSGTNQLANAIAGQQAKPQRAYVVANDVTTAQGLDRNIVEGASI